MTHSRRRGTGKYIKKTVLLSSYFIAYFGIIAYIESCTGRSSFLASAKFCAQPVAGFLLEVEGRTVCLAHERGLKAEAVMKRLLLIFVLLLSTLTISFGQSVVKSRRLGTADVRKTPSGIPFAMIGTKKDRPAPLLIMFGGAMQVALEDENSNKIGWILAEHGFLTICLDLPSHGAEDRPGSPSRLPAWRMRLENGENFLPPFFSKVRSVLEFLIQEGYADPKQVGVYGSSRAGFMALHFAAQEPRVRYAVALSPVTDLVALEEFKGMETNALTRSLDVMHLADRLSDRALWMTIGHNDRRVDTQHAIEFALKVMELSPLHKNPMTHFWSGEDMKFTITPSEGSSGHSTYNMAHEDAAAWVLRWSGKDHHP